MRFYMLINGGKLFESQILKSETVDLMTKNQLPKGVHQGGKNGFGLGFSVQLKNAVKPLVYEAILD